MSQDTAADAVFEEWRRRAEEGEALRPEDVLRAHPEIAPDLEARFAALARLDEALGNTAPRPPPRAIGGYRILREIARGGMGVVYEAAQPELGRRVALKVLYPSLAPTQRTVERFRQEAKAAGRLKHTNIVSIHAFGQDDGLWYCAMELVDGPSLARVLDDMRRIEVQGRRERRRSSGSTSLTGVPSGTRAYYERVASMFAEVADALQEAHGHGVVHRDVKPSNLLLDADGRLRVLDFGLARLEDASQTMTSPGDVVGTPLYMSPEQFRGDRDALDGRTDVYSLGVTIYETLALRPPFAAREPTRLAAQILTEDPPPVRVLDARIPRDLETVVTKAIEKDPHRRYATAAELARDLREVARGGTIQARRVRPWERTWRRVRRNKVRTLLVALAATALAVAALGWRAARVERTQRIEHEYGRLLTEARRLHDRAVSVDPSSGLDVYGRGAPDAADRLENEIHDRLDRASALSPSRYQAWLLRATQPLFDSEATRFCSLDHARALGLGERTYWQTRGLIALTAGDVEGALAALTASERAGGAEDWDHLQLAQRLAEAQGDLTRSDALLDRLIDKGVAWPPARIHLELKRAVRRQSRGDVEGAIEDLLRVEGAFSSSASVGLRVRIAELWRQVGQEGRYRESTDSLLAETARTGSEDAWQDLLAAVASVRDVPLEGRATKAAVEADPDADWAKAHRILYLVQPYEDPRELASWTSPDLRYREALRLIDDLEAPPRAPSSKQRGSLLCWRVTALQRLDQAREALAALAGPDGENLEEKVRMTLRGTLLVQTGDVSEGISVLETARAKFPRDHSVVCTLCWNYQAAHRYADAARAAGEAILTDPGCLLCREVLAESLMRQGDLPGALRATEEGLAVSSTCVRLLAVRGEVLDMLDLHRESADTLSRLLTTPAAWPPLVYLSQAENLTWLGRFPEAHALLQRWRADMPDDPAADRQEAVTDTTEGHWEHALDVIRRARAAHPDLDASWDGLELTVLRALDHEEDARALAKRILASPTGRDPASLVFAEIALGHVDVARGMLVAESPPDAPAPELDAYDAACARALLGDDESAIELLEKAAAAGWVWPPYWAPDPDLKRVWNDPRFVRLRREHSQVR